ncbi:hypothetical protein NA57DRAFT_55031 [Rhizodiscina lignyota]|uniref:Uncharacterized protein n=1 Tax=Rhizodiscina lignyota TaxID=1504668 RepID=A0A9P4MCS8_9PEZI|nr:hypothetical protein NA57DRAFT_55031 [Rhizodiscina lignyota]
MSGTLIDIDHLPGSLPHNSLDSYQELLEEWKYFDDTPEGLGRRNSYTIDRRNENGHGYIDVECLDAPNPSSPLKLVHVAAYNSKILNRGVEGELGSSECMTDDKRKITWILQTDNDWQRHEAERRGRAAEGQDRLRRRKHSHKASTLPQSSFRPGMINSATCVRCANIRQDVAEGHIQVRVDLKTRAFGWLWDPDFEKFLPIPLHALNVRGLILWPGQDGRLVIPLKNDTVMGTKTLLLDLQQHKITPANGHGVYYGNSCLRTITGQSLPLFPLWLQSKYLGHASVPALQLAPFRETHLIWDRSAVATTNEVFHEISNTKSTKVTRISGENQCGIPNEIRVEVFPPFCPDAENDGRLGYFKTTISSRRRTETFTTGFIGAISI